MLAKRIIPCLDVKDGRVVKGVNFVDLRDAGDPAEQAKIYGDEGADELVFLDITATIESRDTMTHVVESVADQVMIPLTVGGGIRSARDFEAMLHAGADKVGIDRRENRHAAFGLGIHRCVGSNLARMEMQVAIEEWLKRIPDFRLDPAGTVTWSQGTVRGPRQLPILFGRPM